ncbi:MAG: DUF4198 domain-containing protein [Synergistaceae bacterium]|nr:DUF4198 domain-containing protein [Synergistaceae bacterium]
MKGSFVSRKFLVIAGAVCAAMVLSAGCSEAHSFVIEPVRNTVALGEAADVWVTLSEPFATPDLSLYGYGAEIEAQAVYASGKKDPITGFSFFNSKNPSDSDPSRSDVQKASFSASEAGTVVVCAKMTMQMPKEVVPSQPYLVCFAKNAMNMAEDGAAQKAVGGNGVLEIVPMRNLNGIAAEVPFKVQVFFKGKPFPGATVSAAYDGLPIDEETGEQAYSVHAVADENGVASVTFERAAFWLLSVAHETMEGDTPYQYQGTLVVPVNGKEGETERVVSDMLMPAANNEAGLGFAEFIEDQLPEADAFFAENNLRWSAYLATGQGSSAFYTKGKNQLEDNSGVTFTVPVGNSGADALTGFFSVYTFTPGNIGEDAYKTLTDELSLLPASEGGMVVAGLGELFPKLGLSIFQVYADGTERDVTHVMVDPGFLTSETSEGGSETAMYWGALVADRAHADGYSIPVVLSSSGEDGDIVFDGKRDAKIDGTFYIARRSEDSDNNGSGGCNVGLGGFVLVGLGCVSSLRRRARLPRSDS